MTKGEEKRLNADLVIMAVGVKPNSELAEGLGLELGPSDAVLTDEKLRTNVQDIYAVGDVTASRHMLTGEPTWLPLGDTANKQGRVAGTVIAGKEASFRGILGTAVTKVFERAFATTGLDEKAAQEAGFDAASLCIEDTDHAGYYPDHSPLTVTLVWEKGSQKLLGAQLAGSGDAVEARGRHRRAPLERGHPRRTRRPRYGVRAALQRRVGFALSGGECGAVGLSNSASQENGSGFKPTADVRFFRPLPVTNKGLQPLV